MMMMICKQAAAAKDGEGMGKGKGNGMVQGKAMIRLVG
jgi:hypothetical protein